MTIPVKPRSSDPDLASPFRVDWLSEDVTRNERDDIERAIAEKAADVLRSARFVSLLHDRFGTETEIKVWLPTGFEPAFVAVHYEPRLEKHYFLVLDWRGQERLAAVVFERVPSVTGAEAQAETDLFMSTCARVLQERDDAGIEMPDLVAAIQTEYATMESS